MIKVGIIGGAGYTAGELIRLLLNHPEAEIVFINSSSNAGNKITDVHEGLYGETDLVFTDQLPLEEIDVLFFCTAHGDTKKFLESHNVPEELRIIDLSMDYRIASPEHDFIPYRGDFPRGIFTSIVVKTKVALEEIVRMYEEYYAKDSFTHIVEKNIDLKQVVNTNKCLIHLEKHGDKLLIISCIDNLLKGASGQAVHNMNLMFNLEETVGLRLKPSAF